MNYETRLRQLEQRIGRDEESSRRAEVRRRCAQVMAGWDSERLYRLRELGARLEAQMNGDDSDPLTASEHTELHDMIHEIQSEAQSLD